ncbi:hypothetical protein [Sinisalibacter lacisalsi]|nr:hypothetical protein [Sinisalibacter lacisalsi]
MRNAPMPSLARLAVLATLALLAACARPLTPNETVAAKALFGDTLDAEAVKVRAGVGLLPLPREPQPDPDAEAPAAVTPPPGLCERKQSTRRVWRWPAAFVLQNDVFFSYDYYPHDAFRGFPRSVPYPASVIMAHELVHVWQWQNRAHTGYSPTRAAGETVANVDPYWFTANPEAEFFRLGYEQQGAMVQDFVCYAMFDSQSPRLGELAEVLRPVLPVDDFLALLPRR